MKKAKHLLPQCLLLILATLCACSSMRRQCSECGQPIEGQIHTSPEGKSLVCERCRDKLLYGISSNESSDEESTANSSDTPLGTGTLDLTYVTTNDGFTYYGYADLNGRTVIDCIYETAEAFSDGLACVSLNGYYGWINENGETVIPFEYDEVQDWFFREETFDMALVRQGDWWGWINRDNEVVIPFQYLDARPFDTNGYAKVNPTKKGWGIIDTNGKIIVPTVYPENGIRYDDGFFCIEKSTMFGAGIYNSDGELMKFDLKADNNNQLYYGFLVDGSYIYASIGSRLDRKYYEYCYEPVSYDVNLYNLYDFNGKPLLPQLPIYEIRGITYPTQGRSFVCVDGYYGGNDFYVMLDPEDLSFISRDTYKSVTEFSYAGYAAVRPCTAQFSNNSIPNLTDISDHWIVIDTDGTKIYDLPNLYEAGLEESKWQRYVYAGRTAALVRGERWQYIVGLENGEIVQCINPVPVEGTECFISYDSHTRLYDLYDGTELVAEDCTDIYSYETRIYIQRGATTEEYIPKT